VKDMIQSRKKWLPKSQKLLKQVLFLMVEKVLQHQLAIESNTRQLGCLRSSLTNLSKSWKILLVVWIAYQQTQQNLILKSYVWTSTISGSTNFESKFKLLTKNEVALILLLMARQIKNATQVQGELRGIITTSSETTYFAWLTNAVLNLGIVHKSKEQRFRKTTHQTWMQTSRSLGMLTVTLWECGLYSVISSSPTTKTWSFLPMPYRSW
jgi:hypothetical protein